jgi:hypothetical protein
MGRHAFAVCHLIKFSSIFKRSPEFGSAGVAQWARWAARLVYFGLESTIHGNNEPIGAQTSVAQKGKE